MTVSIKYILFADYEKPCGRVQDEARYHLDTQHINSMDYNTEDNKNIATEQDSNSNAEQGKHGNHSTLPKSRTRKEEEFMGADAHSLTVSSAAASTFCCAKYSIVVLTTTGVLLAHVLSGQRHGGAWVGGR